MVPIRIFSPRTPTKVRRNLKQPSHVKLMLANSCWQTQTGVSERHNNVWQTVGEKQNLSLLSPTFRQQFANMLLRRSHTPIWVCQHELANIRLTCEGRIMFRGLISSKHFLQHRSNISFSDLFLRCNQCWIRLRFVLTVSKHHLTTWNKRNQHEFTKRNQLVVSALDDSELRCLLVITQDINFSNDGLVYPVCHKRRDLIIHI